MSLTLPWEIAYPDDKINTVSNLILGIFYCDILINLRTTYYNELSAEIVDYKMILKNYMFSTYFIIDIISAIHFDAI